MSGISLLLSNAIDYEITHQLTLFTLFRKSCLAKHLFGINDMPDVEWEPDKQLFDLALINSFGRIYLELKMWSPLGDKQLDRQSNHLIEISAKGYHLLLGSSWFERKPEDITNISKGKSAKIGYNQLLQALTDLLTTPDLDPDVKELALAYRKALQEQLSKFTSATKEENPKLFYYNLYRIIQENLTINCSIYTVNNSGGEKYILNFAPSYSIAIDNIIIYTVNWLMESSV